MFCTNCGARIDDKAAFCSQCGARRPGEPAHQAGPPQPRLQPTAPPRPQPLPPPKMQPYGPPAVKKSSNTGLIIALVVIGGLMFLGIVSAIAIPNLLKARETAKVKSTKQNIKIISTAIMDYVTDYGTAPPQSGDTAQLDEIKRLLVPIFLKAMPNQDAWGYDYLIFCGEGCNGRYGLSGCKEYDFLVVSCGKDGVGEAWIYDPNDVNGGLFRHSSFADFDKDLVMFNGTWIRGPYDY
jgi:type II secretory pathway pseudopilin PulG